jgi:hypothetical protein
MPTPQAYKQLRPRGRPYWVIEHGSRGNFDRWDHDPKHGKWRPFFHYAGARSDHNIKRFYDQTQAERELAKVNKAVPGCYLFRMSGG